MSIWHHSETPGYNQGKGQLGFTRWRVLVMERTAEILGVDESQAVQRIADYGLMQLGLDYDNEVTVEDLAQRLAW